ncbi:hypothetical protein [Streptomyces sp. Ac-502]|uniref:hypothetical protein n=1 Tax=Streptomyces sp. Ac-502 TaxID=3342801 RepID=UPI00386271F6
MRAAGQQGGRWPALPDWMRQCLECCRHYGVYRVAAGTTHLAQVSQRHTRVSTHIVAEHPEQVPDYVPGCRRCDQHRATATPYRIAPKTALADALHRAGHMYAPPDLTRLF